MKDDATGGRESVPWPLAVSFLLRPLPEEFALSDVYAMAAPLRKAFPNNRHVEAKIRQSLQILRDRGEIVVESPGRYRKFVVERQKSVRLDFGEAARYVSRSQIARVAVESWVARNIDCWRCRSPLLLVPANTLLLDAICSVDDRHEVQVKAVAGISGDRLLGAAYGPIAKRLELRELPDYLVISYDRLREIVLLAEFVDGALLRDERVAQRRALGAGARRAGWVGATIDVAGLERHVVVGPSFDPSIPTWGAKEGESRP
jgi:hypothetical protein